jgi:hypothetical protein
MSVDAIKKFLEDSQNYPDNTLVTIGDTQVPLSSLRSLNATERTQVADRLKEIDAEKAELKAKQGAIVGLATKAQEALTAAEAARDAAARPAPKPGDDPFSDPWLAPVKTALESRDKGINELRDMLRTTLTTVTNAATIFSEERWDGQYAAINFGKRDKKPTRQELLDLATKEGLKDRHGLPSVTKAWEKFSEGDRIEEIRQSALEQGRQEGRNAQIASRVPAPGVAGPGQAPQIKINPNGGDLGDLHAQAIADPELRAILDQAATLGVM